MTILTELLHHGDEAATYEHHCSDCHALWCNWAPHEPRCPFCGSGEVEDE